MTKFLKTVAMIGAALVVFGIVLAVCGWIGGGQRYLGNNIFSLSPSSWNYADRNSVFETDELEPFHSIQVDGNAFDLDFCPSDDASFGLQFQYNQNLMPPEARVENGVLYLHSNWPSTTDPGPYRAVVTYPAGTPFNSLDIRLSICTLSMRDLNAQSARIDLNASESSLDACTLGNFQFESNIGTLNISNSQAELAQVKLDIGNLEGRSFNTNGLSAQVNLGNLTVSGKLEGSSNLKTNVGNATVIPSLPEENYSIRSSAFVMDTSKGNPEAPNRIIVETNVGNAEALTKRGK